MSKTFRFIWETYTPAEAAAVTDVPVELQRDWRRREIEKPLESGKHPRWTASDLARLFVRGQLSRAGISVKQMGDIAALAEWPIRDKIADICLKGDKNHLAAEHFELARYVVWTPDHGAVRTNNLSAVLADKPLIQIVIDCHEAAETIVDRAPRTLIRLVEEQ